MWKVKFKLWPQLSLKESDIYRHAPVLNTLGEEGFGRVSQYLPYAVFFSLDQSVSCKFNLTSPATLMIRRPLTASPGLSLGTCSLKRKVLKIFYPSIVPAWYEGRQFLYYQGQLVPGCQGLLHCCEGLGGEEVRQVLPEHQVVTQQGITYFMKCTGTSYTAGLSTNTTLKPKK